MILVFVETDAGGAAEPSLEAVTFARELVTRDTGELAGAAGARRWSSATCRPARSTSSVRYGVSEVHHAVGDAFSAYGGAAWAAALQAAQRAPARSR